MYFDTWRSISRIIKNSLDMIFDYRSDASHYIMLSPKSEYTVDQVLQVLKTMEVDPVGKSIMQKLCISEWIPVEDVSHIGNLAMELGIKLA